MQQRLQRIVWNLEAFRLTTLAAIFGLLISNTAAAADHILGAWTQFAPDGVVVRIIIEDSVCPSVLADGRAIALHIRAPNAEDFPAICEGAIAANVKHLQVGERSLSGPAAASKGPQRILVIGDTGCRLKNAEVQDCNDPNAWPFSQIAARAAARHPDLIIHLGDYYYRETPCPVGRTGCAGSPYGDRWPSWAAEFFGPAAPLLSSAPWVFVRGNHESCGRGAGGWLRYLDASPEMLECPAVAAPFTVKLGGSGPTLNVLDSADTVDESAPPEKVAQFAGQIEQLGTSLSQGPDGWLLTHRPIWGINPKINPESGLWEDLQTNLTEQAAARGKNFDGINMIVSGHVHFFAAIDFKGGIAPRRPAQLIVGNGGDSLSVPEGDSAVRSLPIDGLEADTFRVQHFGYLMLERTGSGSPWIGTLYGKDDIVLARCTTSSRQINCRAP